MRGAEDSALTPLRIGVIMAEQRMSHKRAYSRSHGICIGNLFCIARHSIHEVLEDHLMYEHEHEHEHEDWGSKSGVQMGCCRNDCLSECRHAQSISIEIYHLTTVKERKSKVASKYLCIYLSVHHSRYLRYLTFIPRVGSGYRKGP